MKLIDIAEQMWSFNQSVAFGSECDAWDDFVADCYREYGISPWDDKAHQTETSETFSGYWQLVSVSETHGATTDYDAFGARRD